MPPKATNNENEVEEEKAATSLPVTTAPTLRHRHQEKRKASSSNAAGTASATATNPQHFPEAPPRASAGITWKQIVWCAVAVVGFIASILFVFLALQVALVDNMDFEKTTTRMELAGWGEEWLPVWLGNFMVDSFTAIHMDVTSGGDGAAGGVWGPPALSSHQSAGPVPPPPRISKPRQEMEGMNSTDSGADSSFSSKATASAQLRCYTLEAYSETFLKSPRKVQIEHFFSCGTRVRDLRSEDRPDVLSTCEVHTIYPKSSTGDQAAAAANLFPTLRVVLTLSEEKRHHALQPVNTVTQRIPLSRVNDDYCDCLDGTDELLTNACSVSGPLSPAAASRWKSYLISEQAIQLYDDPDMLEQEDRESHGFLYTPRRRGDVGDRLYVSQGPVLPFVCTCGGAVRQLLAPSLVGDGIVDCCAAEDEAVLQGSPFVPSSPSLLSNNNPPSVQAELSRILAAEQQEVMLRWQRQQAEAATHFDSAVRYADDLFPYHTSAQALLVDKGYYSLFSPDVVVQERKAAATILHNLYARGHLIQRRRMQKGWERLGQGLTENRTAMQVQLVNLTRELEELERLVWGRMEERRTNDPVEAGVPKKTLKRHALLSHAYEKLQMELQHLVIANIHNAYGDHYEYYPLVRRALSIVSEKVTDASTPRDLYRAIARHRAKRLVPPSEMEKTAAAQQRGGMGPLVHIDNISVSYYGIETMRQTIAALRFDPSEALYVAQQLGLVPRRSTAPFNPHVFDNITDPFMRSPVLPLGVWQPYQSLRDGRVMQLADPAGGLHLAQRACVTPTSPLYRGGGRLQFPTRHPEPARTVTVPNEENEKSLKEKLKAAAEGTQSTGKKVSIPHHFHMPSTFAVDVYLGLVRCEPDPDIVSTTLQHNSNPNDGRDSGDGERGTAPQTVQLYTTYLCDIKDRVLFWGRNGKCVQEVIIGTPSACSAWALKTASDALKRLTPRSGKRKGHRGAHQPTKKVM